MRRPQAFGAAGFVGLEPGESLDVPAGTLIAVDPQVRREAVATEPDTAVLAFGGPPTFEPAGHGYMARVRGAVDRPDEAIERVPDLRHEAMSDPLLVASYECPSCLRWRSSPAG